MEKIMDDSLVLIVDDDPSVRKSLSRLMASAGLKVLTFSSAGQFIKETAQWSALQKGPACLLLDIKMPGMNGLDLQEKMVKGHVCSFFSNIPVIFITGHGDISMSVKAMKSGAMDFIEKPFEDQVLLEAVFNALKKNQALRADQGETRRIQECINSLTPREHEVFCLVVKGMLNKQIGFDLGISEKTVKVHRGRVMEKMQADSLAHLVRMAQKNE